MGPIMQIPTELLFGQEKRDWIIYRVSQKILDKVLSNMTDWLGGVPVNPF